MKAIDLVIAASGFAPELKIKSKMLAALKKVRPEVPVEKYTGASLMIAAGIGILSLFLALIMNESFAFGFLGFALCFGFLLALPSFELKRRTAEFEARLPLMLRTLGMLLDMSIPFQRALEIVSVDEPVFQPVIDNVRRGVSVQKAFARVALSYDSFAVKRAISQLITSYEVGSSGQEIRKIGEEMLSVQRHSLREYSSKSAIFGLLFIVSAAVMPTFFLVYAVLGEYTLDSPVEKMGMAVAMLVVFPLISLTILLMAKSSLPRSAMEQDSGHRTQDLSVLAPTAFLVLSLLFLPQDLSVIGIAIGCAGAGYLVYLKYNEEKKTEDVERHLPDALFSVSGLPKSTKMDDLFGVIEKAGYGALSEEAAKSRKQLNSNLSVDLVLEDLAARNSSGMLVRACEMLRHVFSTNSFSQLNRLAEDMLQFVEIRRERAGLLAMQKYTLVFGGLIVPLILKITLGLLESMAEFFTKGGEVTQLDFAFSLIPAYIIVYALLSSFYISNIDERRSRSAGYFLAIAVVGLATFFIVNI